MNFFLKSVGVCLCLYLCLLPVAIVTVTVRPQKSARICRVTMTLQSKLPPHPEPEPHSIQQRSMNHILATSSLSFRVLSSSLALVASWPVKADNLDTTSTNSLLSPKAYQTRTGLRYIDNVEGTGVSPQYGQLVAFNYEIFYRPPGPAKPERVDWTKTPFLHKHGNGRICRGLDEALHTMRVGGRRRAILTPAIGYTEFGVGPLPTDPRRRRRLGQVLDAVDRREGDLVFDVELVLVRDDENDQGYYGDTAVSQEDVRRLAQQIQQKNIVFAPPT